MERINDILQEIRNQERAIGEYLTSHIDINAEFEQYLLEEKYQLEVKRKALMDECQDQEELEVKPKALMDESSDQEELEVVESPNVSSISSRFLFTQEPRSLKADPMRNVCDMGQITFDRIQGVKKNFTPIQLFGKEVKKPKFNSPTLRRYENQISEVTEDIESVDFTRGNQRIRESRSKPTVGRQQVHLMLDPWSWDPLNSNEKILNYFVKMEKLKAKKNKTQEEILDIQKKIIREKKNILGNMIKSNQQKKHHNLPKSPRDLLREGTKRVIQRQQIPFLSLTKTDNIRRVRGDTFEPLMQSFSYKKKRGSMRYLSS